MPIPSREMESLDLEDISRRYESMRTRPEFNSLVGEEERADLVRSWDFDRGLPDVHVRMKTWL